MDIINNKQKEEEKDHEESQKTTKVEKDDKDKKIAELENKAVELDSSWKRALADYQNLIKRTQSEKYDIVFYGSQKILLKFLDILDHLEEAQKHLQDKGIELVIKLFNDALKEEGVFEIESMGGEFNPEFHECVDKRQGEKNNIIIEVARKGYMLKDRVLRPAKVIVEVNK